MRRLVLIVPAAAALACAGVVAAALPQGTQTDAAFAASYAARGVVNVSATTQRVSCYAPELAYLDELDAGATATSTAACRPATAPPRRARSSARTRPRTSSIRRCASRTTRSRTFASIRLNPNHLIGQSKWAVSAEGYNHLLGFYESFDGGATWPVQGHVPGYEGWTDNTDPVGAFDPWGNFYSLVLPYQFYYDKSGFKKYDNGSNQTNPTVPPEAIAVSVHPAATLPGKTPARAGSRRTTAIRTTSRRRRTRTRTTRTSSGSRSTRTRRARTMGASTRCGRSSCSTRRSSTSRTPTRDPTARTRTGRHRRCCRPSRASAGTRTCCRTSRPTGPSTRRSRTTRRRRTSSSTTSTSIWSKDGGDIVGGPASGRRKRADTDLPEHDVPRGNRQHVRAWPAQDRQAPTRSTSPTRTARAVCRTIYLTASYDGGQSWTTADPGERQRRTDGSAAAQPAVAPNGTVTLAFYDRRLPCPGEGDPDALAPASHFDPGTDASPGTPCGRSNYCVNTAIQFYTPSLTPIGNNVRALGAHMGSAALRAAPELHLLSRDVHRRLLRGRVGAAGSTYTTSVSTYNYAGENPCFHQQQIVAKISTP